MDINGDDEIFNRLDRLQEKVSRQNIEIIKLQVAQDTAIWEQKEKLADVKSEYVRLQQNKLQLQMQNEELSSKYQEELRGRHEILNKANTTRKKCDELEKLAQQCMEESARGKADRERLVAIYAAADKTVCGLQQRHEDMVAQAKTRINELLEKLKGKNEQQEQLREKYNESQLQLQAARSDRNELAAATEDAKKQLEAANTKLNKRDDAITNLKREMRNMATNNHSQLAEAKNILTKKDNDLKSATEEIESLKKALSNQEEVTKMQCDRNNELQKKLALVEDQQQLAEASNDASNKKLELRSPRATEERHFAFASEMRSPSQRPPTPAPQWARDARCTLQPQVKASQFASFEQLRAGRSPTPTTPTPTTTKAPTTAADAFTAESKTTIKRFFKSPRNISTAEKPKKKK